MSLGQASFLSGDAKRPRRHTVQMQKGRAPLTAGTRQIMETTGERLRLLADLHAMGPKEMERCLGLSHGHWRLIAAGERPLTVEVAIRVCDQFRVCLAWLFQGRPSEQVDPDVLANLVALRPDLTERRSMGEHTGKKPKPDKALRSSEPAA